MAQRIDPKEILKNNLPLWITYGVALVPVVLWFLVVGGVVEQVQKSEGALKNQSTALESMAKKVGQKDADPPLYTPQDVEHFKKRKELYQAALDKLSGVVQSRDAPLERWFKSGKWQGTDIDKVTPEFADYQVEYSGQVDQLKKTYAALLKDPSLVYSGEGLSADKMVKFQKRFWVQQAVLDALKAGGARQLAARVEFPEASAAGAQGDPDRPYTPITVRFAFLCSFRDLPRVTHALLTQEIAFRITQLVIEKAPIQIEKKEPAPGLVITGPEGVFESESYGAKFRDQAPPSVNDQDAWIPEPPVRVDITLDALDFRPAPKPAPPADGAGEEAPPGGG